MPLLVFSRLILSTITVISNVSKSVLVEEKSFHTRVTAKSMHSVSNRSRNYFKEMFKDYTML